MSYITHYNCETPMYIIYLIYLAEQFFCLYVYTTRSYDHPVVFVVITLIVGIGAEIHKGDAIV